MKKLIFSLLLIAFVSINLKAQTDYVQVEVMGLKPKADKLDLFKKGLTAHNKKYHAKDPHKVSVYSVITGPYSGGYAWVMGPTNWAQMDGRPGKGEHDTDWEKNVAPYCESGEISYWRMDKEIQYNPANAATFTKSRLRFHTVMTGQNERFMGLLKKVVEVYKKKQYPLSYSVHTKYGASTGPHVVVILSFDKWASLDALPASFMKDYEEVHGAGTWAHFQEDLSLSTDRSKTYDELNELVAELSGGN